MHIEEGSIFIYKHNDGTDLVLKYIGKDRDGHIFLNYICTDPPSTVFAGESEFIELVRSSNLIKDNTAYPIRTSCNISVQKS